MHCVVPERQGPKGLAAKLNAAWHKAHPMPPRATLAQRVAWHRQHAKHCGCRPIPPGVLKAMRKGAA